MLIGYIEQEILEGKFWYFWKNSYPTDLEPIDLQIDLQKYEEEEQEQLEMISRSQPVDVPSSSRPFNQHSQR